MVVTAATTTARPCCSFLLLLLLLQTFPLCHCYCNFLQVMNEAGRRSGIEHPIEGMMSSNCSGRKIFMSHTSPFSFSPFLCLPFPLNFGPLTFLFSQLLFCPFLFLSSSSLFSPSLLSPLSSRPPADTLELRGRYDAEIVLPKLIRMIETDSKGNINSNNNNNNNNNSNADMDWVYAGHTLLSSYKEISNEISELLKLTDWSSRISR